MKTQSVPETPKAARSSKKTPRGQAGNGNSRPHIPKRWRWHYETLSGLLDQQRQQRGRLLSEGAAPIETYSIHQADSASDEFDQELALSQLSVEQDALYEVESAIERIANGSYGVCEETGEPIPVARLKAVPWTRYCKEAKERLECAGGNSRARLGTLRSVRAKPDATLAESIEMLEERARATEPQES